MFAFVNCLIDFPSSQGVTHGEREGEECLLRPGEALGLEGTQLLGILHVHLKLTKSSLAGHTLQKSRHSKHQCRTSYEQPDSE